MAVVRNCLFHLLVISNFVIYVQKGIAHAQNCLQSTEKVVPKCPENQREWEEAAQRKKCSEIGMNVNCTDVEYHCLVNEFRNETIEVCTKPKVLQGFCPIYSSLNADGNEYMKAVRNDYNKKCEEYPYPCNCSSGSRSTEAYKWQCCYNGTNKLSSVESQNDTDRDKKSSQLWGLWMSVEILLGLLIMYGGCVFYRYKLKNMPISEAVCIWKNIPCTSQIFARLSSDSREDGHEKDKMLPKSTTKDTIVATEETSLKVLGNGDHMNSVTNEAPTDVNLISVTIEAPSEDGMNSVTNEAQTPEEEEKSTASSKEGRSNSDQPDSLLTPNNNNSNSGTSEVDGAKPLETPKKDNSISGSPALLTPKSVTDLNLPIRHPSDNGSTAEDLCHNPVEKWGDHMNTENVEEVTLEESVEHLEDLKKELEGKLFPLFGKEDDLLYYKVGSTKQKMLNMKRNAHGSLQMTFNFGRFKEDKWPRLQEKNKILEKSLKEMHKNIDVFIAEIGECKKFRAKQGHEKPAVNFRRHLHVQEKEKAEKSENKLAGSNVIINQEDALGDNANQKDYNTDKKEDCAIRMPPTSLTQVHMVGKKSKDTLWSPAANEASFENQKGSAKFRTEELIANFESWRRAIQSSYSGIDNLENKLLEIEDDTVILNRLFGFDIPELRNENEEGGQQKANPVNDMEQTYEELYTMFTELEEKYS